MSETVLYMRGRFPFLAEPSTIPRMVEDAKPLLNLDEGTLGAIKHDLGKTDRFLDRKAVEKILETHISQKEIQQSTLRFLVFVIENIGLEKDTPKRVLGLFRQLVENQSDDGTQLLTKEQFQQLEKRLPFLLEPFSGLVRQLKAEELSTAIGKLLEEIKIICDLRPIFDDSRTNIEGMIPYTTLKVVVKGVDGLPVSLEAVLSERQVHELVDAAEKAKTKLKHLREFAVRHNLPVPSVELTQTVAR